MKDYDKEIIDDKLTQADLIKLMLHNAQHMATREELKASNLVLETGLTSVKEDINKLDNKIDKVEISLKADNQTLRTELKEDNKSLRTELKEDIKSLRIELKADNQTLRTELKTDNKSLRTELKEEIQKIDTKFDRMQWLIISTIVVVLLKDQIVGLFTLIITK